MNLEREYIVTLKNSEDWDTFHTEMLEHCVSSYVPNRNVECTNERPFSDTQTHYNLTDAEAEQLRLDPRVLLVELDVNEIPGMHLKTTASQTGIYDNTSNINASMKNWGLLRTISVNNPFSNTTSSTGPYTYNLTGKNVDIIVLDTGVAENHPELAVNADGTGGSRVVDYDWTQLGVPGVTALSNGTGIKGFLGDGDGHGTNCATIAAGNTCGWAKDAKIYSIRCIPSFDSTNSDIVTGKSLGLINITLVFDLVKAFHLAKPVDSNGHRRPTICTNSWSFVSYYTNMTNTTWRGTNYNTLAPSTTYGQMGSYHEMRYSSLDIAAAEVMAAGVIVLGAAGNSSHKIDITNGIDYNNTWTDGYYTYYYHRGGTPGAATATVNGKTYQSICVGALDRNSIERKAYFSNTGPRVDLYSPGYYIMGGGSADYTSVADPRDSSGTYRLCKLTGTSQATPQIAGILACLAQLRPNITQDSARAWLIANGLTDILDQSLMQGTGYTNKYYLQGGPNIVVQMPYNADINMQVSGEITGIIPGVAL